MCFSDKKYILSLDGTVLRDLCPFPHPQIAILYASPLLQLTIDALQHPIIKSFLDQLATCHPRVQRVIFEFDPVENSDDTVDSLSGALNPQGLASPICSSETRLTASPLGKWEATQSPWNTAEPSLELVAKDVSVAEIKDVPPISKCLFGKIHPAIIDDILTIILRCG